MSTNPLQQYEKTIVLTGLMGAGKTSVGRKLAKLMELNFVDVDEEISKAAGCSIEDIFEKYGEVAFRDVEERVMARLLNEKTQVLATGGGAIMNPRTLKLIKDNSVSIWLRADLDILVRRTSMKEGRPLLKNKDNKKILKKLLDERSPIYAKADITVDSCEEGPDATAKSIENALLMFSMKQLGSSNHEK
ncbi:MAG: shikimate kinase [Pseudomonadota bacterium]|nr:shikimate kinase [Pseudomonadota bacterium]